MLIIIFTVAILAKADFSTNPTFHICHHNDSKLDITSR